MVNLSEELSSFFRDAYLTGRADTIESLCGAIEIAIKAGRKERLSLDEILRVIRSVEKENNKDENNG